MYRKEPGRRRECIEVHQRTKKRNDQDLDSRDLREIEFELTSVR